VDSMIHDSTHRFARLLLSSAAAVTFTGCHLAIRDQAQVDPIVASDAPFRGGAPFGLGGQPTPIVPNCRIDEWVGRAAGLETEPVTCLASNGQAVELKPPRTSDPVERRTQVQAELMTYADQVCDDHVAKIYANHASLNFDFGFLTTLLSGGAAIASGRAATNLAAEGALVSGTRSLVNSEVYYGYIGPAVMREIRSLRSDLRAQIAAKRSCSAVDYPAQEAIDDALIYHDACSFSTGLASLLSKAGNTRVGEDKLRTAQLAATAAQLAEKKKALATAQEEQAAMDPGTERARQLDATITRLQADIGSLEGILRFAGVVDPSGGAAAPESRVDDAREELAVATEAVKRAKAGAPKNAAIARRDAAVKHLDDVLAQRRTEHERDLKLAQWESELATLSERKAALLGQKVPDRSEEAAVQRDIDQHQTDIAKARAEQEATSEPKAATTGKQVGDIAFGIQACKPIKIATVQ